MIPSSAVPCTCTTRTRHRAVNSRPLDDPDERGADPVARAGAAGPEPRRQAVLLGLGGLVGVGGRAAEAAPGGVDDLVVAARARVVGREVLAAGLALDDRPRDRPGAA